MPAATEQAAMQQLLEYCRLDPFKVAQSVCNDIALKVIQHNDIDFAAGEGEMETKLRCLKTVLVQCKQFAAKETAPTENVTSVVNSQSERTVFDEVAISVFIPLFKQKSSLGKCTATCLQLIELIHPMLSDKSLETLHSELQRSLDSAILDDNPGDMTRIEEEDAVLILRRLFSKRATPTEVSMSSGVSSDQKCILTKWQQIYLEKVLKILPAADGKLFSSLSNLLPNFLDGTPEQVEQLEAIWALVWGIFSKQGPFNPNKSMSQLSEQPYTLLCALADWLFLDKDPSGVLLKLLSKTDFWFVLQSGFYHSNSLTRKQAMYLLKRILDTLDKSDVSVNDSSLADARFWWSPGAKKELLNVWNDYILLMETLEEKQTHVIKPLMSRLDKLFKATIKRKQDKGLIDTSWITSLLQRIACHESATIRRWGVMTVLTTDFAACPFFEQQLTFFSGPLVVILTDSSIYYKSSDTPKEDCCSLVTALVQFFTSCQRVVDRPRLASFFGDFLHSVAQQHWNGAVLVYVTYGLSQLKPSPIWVSALNDIGCILRTIKQNLSPYIRGTIQCSLMKALMLLLNTEEVSVDDFANVLSILPSDESIKRGTTLWNELAHWLPSMASDGTTQEPSRLKQYLEKSLNEMTTSAVAENAEAMSQQKHVAVARLLLLMCDGGLLPQQPGGDGHALTDTLHGLLSPVFTVIWTVKFHPYVSKVKAEMAIAFLVTLVDECRILEGSKMDTVVNRFVDRLIENSSEGLIVYSLRRIQDITEIEDLPSVHLCCRAVVAVGDQMAGNGVGLLCVMSRLVNTCMTTLQKFNLEVCLAEQLPCHAAMLLLASVCHVLSKQFAVNSAYNGQLLSFLKQWSVVTSFGKSLVPVMAEAQGAGDCHSQKAVGRLMSEFLAAQWSCLQYLLTCAVLGVDMGLGGVDVSMYAADSLDSLDLVVGDDLTVVFQCFETIMPKLEGDLAVRVMTTAWTKVKEALKTALLWPFYQSYVQLAFHPCNLTARKDTAVFSYLQQNAQEILFLGEDRRGLVNTLVTQACRWWEQSPANLTYASNYSSLIVEFCLWGTAGNKGVRLMDEAHSFISNLGEAWSVNQLMQINAKSDRMPRVTMLNMISKLRLDIPEHRSFAGDIIEELMATQRRLVAMKTFKNFPNCSNHLRKHRVCCALLVLDAFVSEVNLDVFWQYVMAMLCQEVQPSVRCLTEWLLVRMVHRRRSFLDHFWSALLQCPESKASYLCSLFTILSQVAKTTEDHTLQAQFCLVAIPRIMPWCSSHHFNLRVYAQAVLVTLWDLCKQNRLEPALSKYTLVESIMEFNEENSNARRNTEKLLDNFFFKFHSVRDYSIETITRTLPYLTMVTEVEWLDAQLFAELDPSWPVDGAHRMPLRSDSDKLKQCNPGTWRVKVSESEQDQELNLEGDVQKKIIPWSAMLEGSEVDRRRRPDTGELVLVTSLIHKIPNLGGLCRTCEIFGVSEFVIANLQYVADKTFQSLSVAAHKWLPIREVKEHVLKDYLQHMRGEGYTLVGVEQTAHSQCLTQYRFPRKTLLLLGSEKEGIPVDLIQMLDVCVEIPQQGIVRSLNVHVSGALLVWEYTRQWLAAVESGGDRRDTGQGDSRQ